MQNNRVGPVSTIIYSDGQHGSLMVGSLEFARDPAQLQQHNISAILTIGKFQPHIDPTKHYLQIPIDDEPDVQILQYMESTNEFIDKHRRDGKNVLVHCMVGKSRSPAFTAAYLMADKEIDFREAARILSNKRKININDGFQKQLSMAYFSLKRNRSD